jgi:hypothetical protein
MLFRFLIIFSIFYRFNNGYKYIVPRILTISSQYSKQKQNILSSSQVDDKSVDTKPNFMEKFSSASIASAAVFAATSVNAAVGMKQLTAPDGDRTFVYKDGASENRTGIVDSAGLPLVYDKALIEAYWRKQSGALSKRWTEFLQLSVPFLTKVVSLLVSGGIGELKANSAPLAKDARIIIEKLV